MQNTMLKSILILAAVTLLVSCANTIPPTHTAANNDIRSSPMSSSQATKEISKRYPTTQSVGYSLADNAMVVSIYVPSYTEAYYQKVKAELTELVGQPVKLEFMSSPMQLPIWIPESKPLGDSN